MKVPYSWLAEWVKVPWPAPELGSRLTMAGIELEALTSAAPPFSDVVVAQIVSAEPHPQADKLQVCRVSIGSGATLRIVCGASNARTGLKSALALVGAQLPGDLTIKAAKLRGVESQGMLASAKELGVAEASAGSWSCRRMRRSAAPARVPRVGRAGARSQHHAQSRRRHVGHRHRA